VTAVACAREVILTSIIFSNSPAKLNYRPYVVSETLRRKARPTRNRRQNQSLSSTKGGRKPLFTTAAEVLFTFISLFASLSG
jgi:hypothetical protein